MFGKHGMKVALKSAPQPVLYVLRLLIVSPLRTCIRFAPWPIVRLRLYEWLASHLWWLETEVVCKTNSGFTLEVDARDIVGKHIYYFGVWEPRLTDWLSDRLRPGDLFIDVGANVGYYTMLASRLVGKSGQVVSVEAMPEIFRRLQRNIEMNHAGNIRSVNVAAWSRVETLTVFSQVGHASGTTTVMSEWADAWSLTKEVKIQARPLEDILSRQEIESVRIIKIDVEGAEWAVVSEMKSWLPLTSAKLEIVIEVSKRMLASQNKSFADVVNLFRNYGFNCYRIQNDYQASSCIVDINSKSTLLQVVTDWPDSRVDQVDLIFSRQRDLTGVQRVL